MPKYYQVGQNYFEVNPSANGHGEELQQVSLQDIQARSGSLDSLRSSGEIQVVDPGSLSPILDPKLSSYLGTNKYAINLLGRDNVYLPNQATAQLFGLGSTPGISTQGGVQQSTVYQDYLSSGGQAPAGGVAGVGASALPDAIKETLDKLYDAGYKINPNAQIGANSLDELLAIAGKEINPYYQTQLKLASDNLKRSLGYSAEQIMQGERDLETKYGRSLRDVGESAAERGFAQSGGRQLEERELASDTQRAIEAGRRSLQFQAGNVTGQFAQKYGGMSGFQLPGASLTQAPRVLPGQASFERQGTQSPFYELSSSVYDNLVGSEEFARRGAIKTRASELEAAQNLQSSLPLRSLNL